MSRKKDSRRKRQPNSQKKSKAKRPDNSTQLNAAFKWFRDKLSFADLEFHGNTSWQPFDLILMALVWSLSCKSTLTESFTIAKAQVSQLGGNVPLSTYQGMLGALVTWTEKLLKPIKIRLHTLYQEVAPSYFRIGRWNALAMDGSRATAPRTKLNEREFCAQDYGKGRTAQYRKSQKGKHVKKKHRKNETKLTPPQMWVTLIWHIGLGIPWDWKLGPSTSSERDHVKQMVEHGHFVKNTLFVGDAGFIGYDLWDSIMKKNHNFMVRVGGNVHLLTNLGYKVERQKGQKKRNGIVYCWPNVKMSKKLPPLVLRLVKCKIGKTNVWLLTNVLDEDALTVKEMKELYERRWGIELEFRSLKQIFERRNMRSRNNERTYVEMHWSILAMAVTELFAIRAQRAHSPRKADPARRSFAKSLRAIRRALEFPHKLPLQFSSLDEDLQNAVLDDYHRTSDKKSRYRSKRKHPPSCGAPKVKKADAKHREKLDKMDWANAP
jgi:hypothetical protein